MVFIADAQSLVSNVHARLSSGGRTLLFGLSISLRPCFEYARSEASDGTVHLRVLYYPSLRAYSIKSILHELTHVFCKLASDRPENGS